MIIVSKAFLENFNRQIPREEKWYQFRFSRFPAVETLLALVCCRKKINKKAFYRTRRFQVIA